MQVLEMIQKGQITAEQGETLLSALEQGEEEQPPEARTLRLHLVEMATGQVKLRVRTSLRLALAAMRLGTKVSWGGGANRPQVILSFGDVAEDASARQVKTAVYEAVQAGRTGKVADILAGDGIHRIEVYVE